MDFNNIYSGILHLVFSFEDINNDLSELPDKLFNKWKGKWEEMGQAEGARVTAAPGAAPGPERTKNLVPLLKWAKYALGWEGVVCPLPFGLPRLMDIAGYLSCF